MNYLYSLHQTPTGPYYLPDNTVNDEIVEAMKTGIYEPEIVETLRPYIQLGTVVIDVGACLGQMAILFAQMVGEKGRVIALEPDQDLVWIARRNCALHGVKVGVFGQAAFDMEGTCNFVRGQTCGLGYLQKKWQGPNDYPVDLVTLDSALALFADKRVSAIKTDCQGTDLQALRGARKILIAHRPAVVMEFEPELAQAWGLTFQDVQKFASSVDYRMEPVQDYRKCHLNWLLLPKEK